jgi:hypothetical protein
MTTMGGGLDEGMLRVTNYKDHPTNQFYKVFFFYKEEQANYFEELLKEKNIFFERDEDLKLGESIYLFAIKKKDLTVVYRLNNIVIGKFRGKFISNKYGRIALIIFGFAVIAVAIMGYFKSR